MNRREMQRDALPRPRVARSARATAAALVSLAAGSTVEYNGPAGYAEAITLAHGFTSFRTAAEVAPQGRMN